MFLKLTIFSLLRLFSRKVIYKVNIYSCFNEYKSCYYDVKRKHGDIQPYMDMDEWNKMSPEAKECLRENSIKQSKIVDEMVALIKIYCKKFPDEKICNYPNFKSYDEYPYRLEQTIPDFIRLLQN